MSLSLRERIRSLPHRPGVYLWKDARGRLLYVGKARDLRGRVAQYLDPARLDPAKHGLVCDAADVEVIVTQNEAEALALEATLIQQQAPPYNIRLVDDRSYLYVKITREPVPRIELTRRVFADGAWYRGPYPNAGAIRRTLREARKIFPWCEFGGQRSEVGDQKPHGLTLDPRHPTSEAKPCFAYHLGLCPGICAGLVSLEEYQRSIEGLKRFLDGDIAAARTALRSRMAEASRRQEYERAANLRDALAAIEKATTPQHVATPRRESLDALGLARFGTHAVVSVLSVRQGRVVGSRHFSLIVPSAEPESAILRSFLLNYLPRATDGAPELLLPERIDDAELLLRHGEVSPPTRGLRRISVPLRGWKRRLLELARANAEEALARQGAELTSPAALEGALADLAAALHLAHPPHRLEAYDVSNLQGRLATGSMVVFIDGQPQRSAYRKFKVHTKEIPDDTAMMREVLTRRFGHRAAEWTLPDLLIVDGGKPQLGVAVRVLSDLRVDLPVAALAKRAEELFFPGRKDPIILPRTSPALFLLQRLRDEAHRFTHAYHTLLRRKRLTRSILEEIPGVGDNTRKKLLRAFGSLRAIRETPGEELAKVVGPKLAETIKDFLAP